MQVRKNKVAKNLELPLKATVKQRVVNEEGDKIGADTSNSNLDWRIDNEKKR